jgi:hypothetical protein
MRHLTLLEQYRRAELSLHALLFGTSDRARGRLKGEGPRRQAASDLRQMRSAFEEAVDAMGEPEVELRERAAAVRDEGRVT